MEAVSEIGEQSEQFASRNPQAEHVQSAHCRDPSKQTQSIMWVAIVTHTLSVYACLSAKVLQIHALACPVKGDQRNGLHNRRVQVRFLSHLPTFLAAITDTAVFLFGLNVGKM